MAKMRRLNNHLGGIFLPKKHSAKQCTTISDSFCKLLSAYLTGLKMWREMNSSTFLLESQ